MKNTLKYIIFAVGVTVSFFADEQTNFETTSWDLVKKKSASSGKSNGSSAFKTLFNKVKPIYTDREWVKYETLFQ